MRAHPSHLSRRHPHHEGIGGHVGRHHRRHIKTGEGLARLFCLAGIDTGRTPVHLLVGAYDLTCTPEDARRTAAVHRQKFDQRFPQLKGAKTTPDEIIAFCREHLAGFKVPKTVVFTPLPKTSTGKIQKFVLRDMAKAL